MAYPSDLVRTKNWGSEVLTDSDLEGQFDLIINWVMASLNSSTGHSHDGTSNNGPKLSSSGVTTTFTNGFTTVTATSSDYVQIADASDSNNTKKALVSDIVTLATPTAASQAEMETATDTTKMATPGRVQYHPGVAKAWCEFNGTGTPAMVVSHNMDSSITDHGTGEYTVSMTTDFSSTGYAVFVSHIDDDGATPCYGQDNYYSKAAGSIKILTGDNSGSFVDRSSVSVVMFGDQS